MQTRIDRYYGARDIEEGEKTLVVRVDLNGVEGLPKPVIVDVTVRGERKLKVAKPFKAEKFDEAGKVLQTTAPIGRALNLPSGAPYPRAKLDSAQRALLDLIAGGGS